MGDRSSARAQEVARRVVNKDVETPRQFRGLRNRLLDGLRIAHVGGNPRRLHAASTDFIGRRRQRLGAAAHDSHVAAVRGQRQRQAAADAAAAAGNERRLPLQQVGLKHHGPSSPSVYNLVALKPLAALTNAFPLWVLAASALALYRPELLTWFSGPLIPIGLGIIMLRRGLTLGFDDFRRIARERRLVLPGVALQYTLMPALGWGLGVAFDLPAPLAAGLILVSCCPGGTASNVISFLARADVALSVTMTAVSTLLAVVMTPFLTAALAGQRVDVPTGDLLLDTVQVVILPVVAGALLKWRFPAASRRIEPAAPLVAVIAITLIVGSVIGAGRQQVIEAGLRLLLAVALPARRRLHPRLPWQASCSCDGSSPRARCR